LTFGFLALWFGTPYLVAGIVTLVAWIVGQTRAGPTIAAQTAAFVLVAVGVLVAFVAATYLVRVLTP
jgi:hypothetical protein